MLIDIYTHQYNIASHGIHQQEAHLQKTVKLDKVVVEDLNKYYLLDGNLYYYHYHLVISWCHNLSVPLTTGQSCLNGTNSLLAIFKIQITLPKAVGRKI